MSWLAQSGYIRLPTEEPAQSGSGPKLLAVVCSTFVRLFPHRSTLRCPCRGCTPSAPRTTSSHRLAWDPCLHTAPGSCSPRNACVPSAETAPPVRLDIRYYRARSPIILATANEIWDRERHRCLERLCDKCSKQCLHLGNLADAFIQSDLQRVHLLKETVSLWCIDRNRADFMHS